MEWEKGKRIKRHEENQIDRLSDLPDWLIYHILSLMNTKYAVQTCILSNRWVSLWTYLWNFNFDSRSFTNVDNLKLLIPFVLDRCNASNINAIRLYLHKGKIQHSLFNRIISFTVSHSVQELDLSFNGGQGLLPLSPEVFRCQSLRVLKLAGLENFGTPRSFSLVSLKTLSLHKVVLENENQCSDLFSSCISLQNLVLDDVIVMFSTVFNVSAPALVNLTMSNIIRYFVGRLHDGQIHFDLLDKQKVVINAPRLTSFSFTCSKPFLLSMDNSPLLENANLNMWESLFEYPDEDEVWLRPVIDMWRQLGHARSLTVSSELVKFLSMHPKMLKDLPSPFHNLKSLTVVRGGQSTKSIPPEVLNFLVRGSPMAGGLLAKFQKPEKMNVKAAYQ